VPPDALAQPPERGALALAARHGGVQHQPFGERAAERFLQHGIERFGGPGGTELAQRVPRVGPVERVSHAAMCRVVSSMPMRE